MFIVLEGIDGSGTTTQTKKLTEFFKKINKPVYQTCEPTSGVIGDFCRKNLAKKQISPMALQFLFVADRIEHAEKIILPQLLEKKIIISDRYFWSTIAYSGLFCQEKFFGKIFQNSKIFPQPDLTIFLNCSPEIAFSRIIERKKKFEIFENKKLLQKISQQYLKIFQKLPPQKILKIDGDKDESAIFKIIKNFLTQKFF